MRPYRRLDLGICRLATLSLLILVSFRRIFLALFQEPQNFPEQHFVFQIDLIIQIGPQPVLLRFAILRHHDDGGRQRRNHSDNQVKQDVGIRIKALVVKQPGIERNPKQSKKDRCRNEFPASTEFSDLIGGAISQGKMSSRLLRWRCAKPGVEADHRSGATAV